MKRQDREQKMMQRADGELNGIGMDGGNRNGSHDDASSMTGGEGPSPMNGRQVKIGRKCDQLAFWYFPEGC